MLVLKTEVGGAYCYNPGQPMDLPYYKILATCISETKPRLAKIWKGGRY